MFMCVLDQHYGTTTAITKDGSFEGIMGEKTQLKNPSEN